MIDEHISNLEKCCFFCFFAIKCRKEKKRLIIFVKKYRETRDIYFVKKYLYIKICRYFYKINVSLFHGYHYFMQQSIVNLFFFDIFNADMRFSAFSKTHTNVKKSYHHYYDYHLGVRMKRQTQNYSEVFKFNWKIALFFVLCSCFLKYFNGKKSRY